MFVQQKQLTVLNVPCNRVAMLYCSGTDIQLALPGLPSQMGRAYLVMLQGGGKVQVLVGLHMLKSGCNVFYISDAGEVPAEQADQQFEEGLVFAESMGFVLNDVELSRMPAAEQERYWKGLPICRRHASPAAESKPVGPKPVESRPVESRPIESRPVESRPAESRPAESRPAESRPVESRPVPVKVDLQTKRQRLKEHLGKLLASM